MTTTILKKCTIGLVLLASSGLQPATADIVSYGLNGKTHESTTSTVSTMPFTRTGAVVRDGTGGIQDTGINIPTQVSVPGGVFCRVMPLVNRVNTFMYNSLAPANLPAAPDGGTLFATEKPGLYYTLEISAITSPGSGIEYNTNGGLFVSNSGTGQRIIGSVSNSSLCDGTSKSLSLSLNIHYYSDSTFNSPVFPGGGFYIDEYIVRFKGGTNPTGVPIGNSGTALFFISEGGNDGGYLGVDLLNTGITITQPTCFGQVVDGNNWNATDNTVNLGTYTTTEIQNGTAQPHDFKITLTNCLGIARIDVRLKAKPENVSTKDITLLKNLYGTSYGVGLKITGKANTYYASKLLVPNNDLSVYEAFEDEQSATSYTDFSTLKGIYGGTQQPLEFSAQLVPDGPGAIVRGGTFETSATFSITYP